MKVGKSGVLNRILTRTECHWLAHDYNVGTTVKECLDETYGCIDAGIACYIENNEYFDEVPYDAIDWDC